MFRLWRKLKSRRSHQSEPASPRPKTSGPEAETQTGRLRWLGLKAGGAQDTSVRYEVIASLLTDVGCRREVNEDCGRYVYPRDERVLADKGLLVLVADGMGGH